MVVAVYGKDISTDNYEYLEELFEILRKYGVDVRIYHEFYRFLKLETAFDQDLQEFYHHEDLFKDIDVLVSVGGDGTILDATTLVRDSGVPILGINLGRLGFLANVAKSEIDETISRLVDGKYIINPRSVIQLETRKNLFGSLNFALNEVSIARNETTSMITIHTFINDRYLNTYWSDGLIICTPTGSTGYNLSCGGPIVMPGSENFVITPIAPHTLTVRPFVISDKYKIRLRVEGRADHFLVSLDSRMQAISPDDELYISKADFKINLVQMEHIDYSTTLRNKLNWGLDQRN
jgi:NAD+ kinase